VALGIRCFRTRRLNENRPALLFRCRLVQCKPTSHSTRRNYAATLMMKRMSRSVRSGPPAPVLFYLRHTYRFLPCRLNSYVCSIYSNPHGLRPGCAVSFSGNSGRTFEVTRTYLCSWSASASAVSACSTTAAASHNSHEKDARH
jgi:hypothetical protein